MGPSSVTSIFIDRGFLLCLPARTPSPVPILVWCERGDLNPHGCPRDPKSRASASSATLAQGRGPEAPRNEHSKQAKILDRVSLLYRWRSPSVNPLYCRAFGC